jgi:site-specific recombinase XerD
MGLAKSTRRTYATGFKAYLKYLHVNNLQFTIPALESDLIAFASYCSLTMSRDTIDIYIQAVRSWHIDNGISLATDPSSMPTLHRLLDGVERENLTPAKVQKHPVTPSLLSQMLSVLNLKSHDDALFFAIACMATYGLMRLGEILHDRPSPSASPLIMIQDIKIVDPFSFQLLLRKSKTDQVGQGATIMFFANGTPSCPYLAVIISYLSVFRVNAHPSSPLFVLSDGSTEPKRSWIVNKLKDHVRELRLDPELFSGHSFRRGGATALAAAGVEDHIIQHMGRWSSTAYQIYTIPTRSTLANAAQRMASTRCVFGGHESRPSVSHHGASLEDE